MTMANNDRPDIGEDVPRDKHTTTGPLDKDPKVGFAHAPSDPTGTSASHPGKPDPVSGTERDRRDNPSDETVREAVQQAAADDTGSLSPIPATFAHLNEGGVAGPPEAAQSQPVDSVVAAVPSDPLDDPSQKQAKEAVTAMYEQQNEPGEEAASQQGSEHIPAPPANRSLRPWLPVALLVGLGVVLAACRR